MADGIDFKIDGLEQLLGKLDSISDDLKRKGGRAALRKAANVIRAAAQAGASRIDDPATAESISKNIDVRWNARRFKRTGDLGFRVGVLGGARQYGDTKVNRRKQRVGDSYKTAGDKSNPGGDTWYWRFVEFGTARTPAKPFLRPALEQNVDKATGAFITEYEKAIDRAIKRAAKKGAPA